MASKNDVKIAQLEIVKQLSLLVLLLRIVKVIIIVFLFPQIIVIGIIFIFTQIIVIGIVLHFENFNYYKLLYLLNVRKNLLYIANLNNCNITLKKMYCFIQYREIVPFYMK